MNTETETDTMRNVAFIDGAAVFPDECEMNARFNEDCYNPRDGQLGKTVDALAAYMEAQLARENGLASPELEHAMRAIRRKYMSESVEGLDFPSLYASCAGAGRQNEDGGPGVQVDGR